MQITNSAYLAVECMAHLTDCTPDRPGKTLWLAQAIHRSVSYTEALMAQLRRAGLVTAKKGAGGGYVLSRPADRITIAEIFSAFDGPCGAGIGPPGKTQRSDMPNTEALWESLRSTVLLFLAGISLADVAAGGAHERGHQHRVLSRRADKETSSAEKHA
ncbi:MAG: RrF2 family transcriptional regulator [Hyphomicrobium sp.]